MGDNHDALVYALIGAGNALRVRLLTLLDEKGASMEESRAAVALSQAWRDAVAEWDGRE